MILPPALALAPPCRPPGVGLGMAKRFSGRQRIANGAARSGLVLGIGTLPIELRFDVATLGAARALAAMRGTGPRRRPVEGPHAVAPAFA